MYFFKYVLNWRSVYFGDNYIFNFWIVKEFNFYNLIWVEDKDNLCISLSMFWIEDQFILEIIIYLIFEFIQ